MARCLRLTRQPYAVARSSAGARPASRARRPRRWGRSWACARLSASPASALPPPRTARRLRAHGLGQAVGRITRRDGEAGEGLALLAVLQEPHRDLVASQVGEVLGGEVVPELGGQVFGVALPDAEGDGGTDVAEHRAAQALRKLILVLVK